MQRPEPALAGMPAWRAVSAVPRARLLKPQLYSGEGRNVSHLKDLRKHSTKDAQGGQASSLHSERPGRGATVGKLSMTPPSKGAATRGAVCSGLILITQLPGVPRGANTELISRLLRHQAAYRQTIASLTTKRRQAPVQSAFLSQDKRCCLFFLRFQEHEPTETRKLEAKPGDPPL